MNKKETIQAIEKRLEQKNGTPNLNYLMKLTEQELFNLLTDIAFSNKFANSIKPIQKENDK